MRKSRRIPNFRNSGIHLRVLLWHGCWLLLLSVVTCSTHSSATLPAPLVIVSALFSEYVHWVAIWCPLLLLSLGLLYALMPWLQRRPYAQGLALMGLVPMLVAAIGLMLYAAWLEPITGIQCGQVLLVCLLDSLMTFYYLDLLQRAYSPAIAEARLQALQARIRPHFLFNSLNAALSLIRSQPALAESTLEDLAELFRVLMADNLSLVPLQQELALCQQYLRIEHVRLGERLHCQWQQQGVPNDVLLPPLVLQPLLENAVYHGIEPLPQGGVISVELQHEAQRLTVRMSNPLAASSVKNGNQMALKNIRERLRLHYDLEASLKTTQLPDRFLVELSLPTRQAGVTHA